MLGGGWGVGFYSLPACAACRVALWQLSASLSLHFSMLKVHISALLVLSVKGSNREGHSRKFPITGGSHPVREVVGEVRSGWLVLGLQESEADSGCWATGLPCKALPAPPAAPPDCCSKPASTLTARPSLAPPCTMPRYAGRRS